MSCDFKAKSPSRVILEPKKRKSVITSTFSAVHEVTKSQTQMSDWTFLFYLPWSNGPDAMISGFFFFFFFSFKLVLSLSFFTRIKRLFGSSSFSAIRVVPSTYLRLLMFLLPVLIPACNSSSPSFLMMCSAYWLNKQNDRRQPCHTPFSILNQTVVPSRVLLLFDLYTGFTGKRVCYFHLFKSFAQFIMIHTVKGFSIVGETEVDDFFWNCLALSSKCWQFDLWFLFLF